MSAKLDHKPGSFTWFHRDEIEVFIVFILVLGFFSRSTEFAVRLLSVSVAVLVVQNVYRWISVRARKGLLSQRWSDRIHAFEQRLPHFPHDRSRLVLSALAVLVLGSLWNHRRMLMFAGGIDATPTDRYWTMFLAWYLLVFLVIFVYLLVVWRKQFTWSQRLHLPFFEGLVGSMFFYHGLPTKSRWITFVAGFLLGGVPSYFATRINPADPNGILYANLLTAGVVVLTIGGTFYTMGWQMAFEKRVEQAEDAQQPGG